jgi:hypothetical protein
MPLGKRATCDFGDARYAGAEVDGADVVDSLDAACDAGFDFVVAPLAAADARRPPFAPAPDGAPPPPFAQSDLLLSADQWSTQVRGERERERERG